MSTGSRFGQGNKGGKCQPLHSPPTETNRGPRIAWIGVVLVQTELCSRIRVCAPALRSSVAAEPHDRSAVCASMPVRKKTFPCGHRGSGKFCHRCAEDEKRKNQISQARAERRSRLSASPIPLNHLPANVADKTLRVIVELQSGASYLDFMGKRLKTIGQRDVILIPVGRRHRLICREVNGSLEFVEAITHEEYNSRLSAGGWPR